MNRLISAVGLFVVGLWVLWLLQIPLFHSFGITWNSQNMGAWGETFGAFNALFAALGFGAVLLTLRQQQQQMAEARDREHREHFDTSFFELLRLFREARLEVSFRHTMEYSQSLTRESRERHTGLEAFGAAWAEANHWITEETTSAADAARAYERTVHNRCESTLGPYFRLLYTMLQRIRDDALLTPLDKVRYANLLRSQLTSFEIAIAALNGLCVSSHDFGALVVEFRLLKYLPGGRRKVLARYYPKSAFEGRGGTEGKTFFRPKGARQRLAAAAQNERRLQRPLPASFADLEDAIVAGPAASIDEAPHSNLRAGPLDEMRR